MCNTITCNLITCFTYSLILIGPRIRHMPSICPDVIVYTVGLGDIPKISFMTVLKVNTGIEKNIGISPLYCFT